MYANQLRRLLATLDANEQIPSNELATLYRPPAGGFIRREDTGETLYVNGQPGGIYEQPTDFTTPDDGGGPMPMARAPAMRQPAVMRVVGYGNGQVTELSPERGDVEPDFTRGQVDVPGVGKGYYSKDGRSAIVTGPGGLKTKVLLGYDAEGSARLNLQEQLRRKAELDMAHTQEQIEASRAARSVKEDPTTQAALEKRYGKAPEGKRWATDGTLEAIPGYGPGKLNEAEAKAAGMGARASAAHDLLSELENRGVTTPGIIKSTVERVPVVGGVLGTAVNALPGALGGPSVDQQKVDQLQRDFVNAVLRPESGASISESEFDNARKQYFPQPGEGPEIVKAKQAARQRELEALNVMAGRGAQPPRQQAKPAATPADRQRALFDARRAIEKGADRAQVNARLRQMGITEEV